MSKTILAVLEQRENKLKKSAFEVTTTAVNLAKDLGLETKAVVIGNEIDNLDEISKYGISDVTHFKNSDLANYSPTAYADVVTNFAKERDAEYDRQRFQENKPAA